MGRRMLELCLSWQKDTREIADAVSEAVKTLSGCCSFALPGSMCAPAGQESQYERKKWK